MLLLLLLLLIIVVHHPDLLFLDQMWLVLWSKKHVLLLGRFQSSFWTIFLGVSALFRSHTNLVVVCRWWFILEHVHVWRWFWLELIREKLVVLVRAVYLFEVVYIREVLLKVLVHRTIILIHIPIRSRDLHLIRIFPWFPIWKFFRFDNSLLILSFAWWISVALFLKLFVLLDSAFWEII